MTWCLQYVHEVHSSHRGCAESNKQEDSTLDMLDMHCTEALWQREAATGLLLLPAACSSTTACLHPHLGLWCAHEMCFAVAKVADLQQRQRQALHHLHTSQQVMQWCSAAASSTVHAVNSALPTACATAATRVHGFQSLHGILAPACGATITWPTTVQRSTCACTAQLRCTHARQLQSALQSQNSQGPIC